MPANPVVDLLSRLVSIPTVNDPARGIRVGSEEALQVRRILAEYGLETDLILNNGVPTLLHVAGEGRPVTLFLAHFDVVPPGPGWTVTEPFKPIIRNGRLYGRGAADDKSNVAAITVALSGYKPSKGTVIIAFTGDEEIGGADGAGMLAKRLEREGLFPDHLVNGDGSLSKVIIRRRSAFKARVEVREEKKPARGTPASRVFETIIRERETMHSAYFTPGVDTHALLEASLWARDNGIEVISLEGEWVKNNVLPRKVTLNYMRGDGAGSLDVDEALTRLVKALLPISRAPIPTEKYSDYGVTVNPNVYEYSGGWHAVVFDIRAMLRGAENVRRALEPVVSEALGGGTLEVEGGVGYLYTPRDAPLVRLATGINAALGLDPEPIEAGGASDSRYYSPRGSQAIDYGPRGYNIHGPNENVVLEDLAKSVEFYRRIAREIHG